MFFSIALLLYCINLKFTYSADLTTISTMSEGEGPSQKKRKVENEESDGSEEDNEDESEGFIYDCIRCGYDHAGGEEGELDCWRGVSAKVGYTNTEDWNSSNWVCQHIPFTEYLRKYKPEKKVDKVGSFLVLGELCENLMTYTQTIESDGRSHRKLRRLWRNGRGMGMLT